MKTKTNNKNGDVIIMFEKILEKSELNNTAFKFVNGKKPTDVIKAIEKDIENLSKLGETKAVSRIVIENGNWIILQSVDNGDPIIFCILDDYKFKSELISLVKRLAESLKLNVTGI